MGNAQNAVDLLFPANRQQVLAALLLQPDRSLHLRELARLTGSNAGTLAREVDKLTQAGLLLRSDQGNQARYSANVQHPLHAELAAIFRKTHGVLPALRAALEPLDGQIDLAFVYGSVASGTHTDHSDVDVLLIGTADFVAVVAADRPLRSRTLSRVLVEVEAVAFLVAVSKLRWSMFNTRTSTTTAPATLTSMPAATAL